MSCRRLEKDRVRGWLVGLARGIFGHQGMGRSLPHDIVRTILDSLISPPAHTPITPSTTSRQPSQGYAFLLLAKRCIPDFRALLPNLTPSNIVNTRDTRYF